MAKIKEYMTNFLNQFLPKDGEEQQRIQAATITSTRLKAFKNIRANAQIYEPPTASMKRNPDNIELN